MRRRHVLLARDRRLELGEKTVIMGVLNVTPDSFSDGGLYVDAAAALRQAEAMIAAGAGVLDIGGESTAPSSRPVTAEVECARVVPVIEALRDRGVLISVDTWKSQVAEAALAAGAHIVNDITALQGDPDMARVVRSSGAGVILMHNAVLYRGTSAPGAFPLFGRDNRRAMAGFADVDLIEAVSAYFDLVLAHAQQAGIDADRIMLDPGFGFGVSAEENFRLFSHLPALLERPLPWLVGVSRKRFVQRLSGADLPADLTTAVLGHAAALNGAHMLRVHDVRLQKRYADMADTILGAG